MFRSEVENLGHFNSLGVNLSSHGIHQHAFSILQIGAYFLWPFWIIKTQEFVSV